MSTFNLSISAPAQNLRRLLMVRVLFLAAVCFSLAVSYWQLDITLAYRPMLWIISALTLINVATLVQLRYQPHTPPPIFVSQLLIDIVGITLLLYFSGGADNPFVSYYLVPLCIAAATLNWRSAWPLMFVALISYTLLFFYRVPLPDLAPHAGHGNHTPSSISSGFSAHTIGMWFNFLVSAGLITFFVVRMAESLRQQNDALTQMKEDRLRDEQLLAVATLAAGTSHELSTPLTTIKTLLHDMIDEQEDNLELRQDLQLLQNQVSQCTNTLSHLRQQAGHWTKGELQMQPLQQYCQQLIDNWLLMRPQANAIISFADDNPEIDACFHPSESQAILNILNNAADANPQDIEINLNWNTQQLIMSVHDYGSGIDPQMTQELGSPFVSQKGEGRGLGLFLTHATLKRHGGQLSLENHPQGGTLAQLTLPVTPE